MAEAVLGLGSNLGARRSILRAASALLHALPGCSVLARSRLYETPPLGPPQPDYLNAALRVRWAGELDELLRAALRIEELLGRERGVRWGPRTLDIDVLHWSEGAVRRAHIEVPHRELASRPFALAPLLDVAPELSPVWGAVLDALKGAPPEALPGWPSYTHEEGAWLGEWLHDRAELLAFAGELMVRCAGSKARALSTLRFAGRAGAAPDEALGWLRERLESASHQGFAVHGVAITSSQGSAFSGVLLGEQGTESGSMRLPAMQIERREDGALRVRVIGGSPDDGLVSGGSVTM